MQKLFLNLATEDLAHVGSLCTPLQISRSIIQRLCSLNLAPFEPIRVSIESHTVCSVDYTHPCATRPCRQNRNRAIAFPQLIFATQEKGYLPLMTALHQSHKFQSPQLQFTCLVTRIHPSRTPSSHLTSTKKNALVGRRYHQEKRR